MPLRVSSITGAINVEVDISENARESVKRYIPKPRNELTAELAYKKQQAVLLGDQEHNKSEIDRLRAELVQISPMISS